MSPIGSALLVALGEWCRGTSGTGQWLCQPESALRAPGHGSLSVLSEISPLSVTLRDGPPVKVAPVLVTHRPHGLLGLFHAPLFVSGASICDLDTTSSFHVIHVLPVIHVLNYCTSIACTIHINPIKLTMIASCNYRPTYSHFLSISLPIYLPIY